MEVEAEKLSESLEHKMKAVPTERRGHVQMFHWPVGTRF